MNQPSWGLLGPEHLPILRRNRSLELAAAVRRFNDLAVPGLGAVWYGKQLFLATLGIAVAEEARKNGSCKASNVQVANAIEALACYFAFDSNDWMSDSRLRGRTKFKKSSKGHADLRFSIVSNRNFYVTQPMRMGIVQALPALGIVKAESNRFNEFECSEVGREFVNITLDGQTKFLNHLSKWVQGERDNPNPKDLAKIISPLETLNEDPRCFIHERLTNPGLGPLGNSERRKSALAWVDSIQKSADFLNSWESKPDCITNTHWRDLEAGAIFFKMRDQAIATLDAIETHMGNQSTSRVLSLSAGIPYHISEQIGILNILARDFARFNSIDQDADDFCKECMQKDPGELIEKLVRRDGQVLRLDGKHIKPGPAFRDSGSKDNNNVDEEGQELKMKINLPDGISYRLRNLYLLNLDLQGGLGEWLKQQERN